MPKRSEAIWLAAFVLLTGVGGCQSTQSITAQPAQGARITPAPCNYVDWVVHEWHRAAATGDLDRYRSLMTEDIVFLGTDKTERWVGEEFIEFCRPYFKGPVEYGQGAWTYKPIEQHVAYSDDDNTAWIDEVLEHERYGHLRGTGVAIKRNGCWLIAHYSLTFLVPNDVALEVVDLVRTHEAGEGSSP